MKRGGNIDAAATWRKRIARNFEPRPEGLIPALQYVQREAGHVPREAITALARHFRVPESRVFGVASFYALFHLKPRGRNQIILCRGTACHVLGSDRLRRGLEDMLGIKAGDTTPDGLLSLDTVGCLGTCALAIPIVINGKVYGRQSAASARRLVKQAIAATRVTGNAEIAVGGGSRSARAARGNGKHGRRVI